MTHQPTPWKIGMYGKVSDNDVLPMQIKVSGASFWNACHSDDQAEVNTKHIVKCVNLHDQLVEALEQCNDTLNKFMVDDANYPYSLSVKEREKYTDLLKQAKEG
jgi:hypothetical protein